MKKFNEFTGKCELGVIDYVDKIKSKLKEKSGADGSTEKTGWIITALIIGALVIGLVNKFAPELGDMVMNKLKEFFNFATVS